MKARWLYMIGLAGMLCLGLALQSPAAKGGVPGKPGGEEPPPDPEPDPEPPAAALYQRVYPEPQPDHYDSGYQTGSINDSGVIAAMYLTADYPTDYSQHTVLLRPDETGTNYRADQSVVLGTNEAMTYHEKIYINNSDQVAGLECAWDDFTREPWPGAVWTNCNYRAVLWNTDGSRTYLWSAAKTNESGSCAINDAGWVVVANYDDDGDDVTTGWPPILNSYIVVPADVDGDGDLDWFVDDDGDGVNDLALLIDTLGYTPAAINSYGEIVFTQGIVLKPDYADSDGDGNPWFADTDGDDINDLFSWLIPLGDSSSAAANDINDLGEVVGSSAARAVVWPNSELSPIDLGEPSDHPIVISASHINNAGQITGSFTDSRNYVGRGNRKAYYSMAFLFQDGQIHDFRAFVPDHGGGHHLNDINDNGTILCSQGYVYVPVDPEP